MLSTDLESGSNEALDSNQARFTRIILKLITNYVITVNEVTSISEDHAAIHLAIQNPILDILYCVIMWRLLGTILVHEYISVIKIFLLTRCMEIEWCGRNPSTEDCFDFRRRRLISIIQVDTSRNSLWKRSFTAVQGIETLQRTRKAHFVLEQLYSLHYDY